MSRFILSAERINADDRSYLVGKESNRAVAVVVRDTFGLECLRCKTPRNCKHTAAVVASETQTVTPLAVPAGIVRGWCKCEGDQIARENVVYFSNQLGHGWNCRTCGLLVQEG